MSNDTDVLNFTPVIIIPHHTAYACFRFILIINQTKPICFITCSCHGGTEGTEFRLPQVASGCLRLPPCSATLCDSARSFAHDAGRAKLAPQTHWYARPCSATSTTPCASDRSSHMPACRLSPSSGCRHVLTTTSHHTPPHPWRSENGRTTCAACICPVAPTRPAHPGREAGSRT